MPEEGRRIGFAVSGEDEGKRLERLLFDRLGLTVRQVRRSKYRTDGICINGRRVRVSERVHAGDRVSVLIADACSSGLTEYTGEAVPPEILYEDNDILAVNKPAGVAVHPSHGHYSDTLANAVEILYRSRNQCVRIRAAGRLDLETSGIVLFAKNAVAAARLSRRKGERGSTENAVRKSYLALAKGTIEKDTFEISLPVGKDPERLNRMLAGSIPGAKDALTNFTVLKRFSGYSFLKAVPETGRTHQIRVHLAAAGHPLLGDRIYGIPGEDEGVIDRAALHCCESVFLHPFTGERIRIEASLPEDMRRLTE